MKKQMVLYLLFILVLVMAGCGGVAPANEKNEVQRTGVAEKNEAYIGRHDVESTDEKQTITVTDSNGTEITLNLPIQKVVVINRNTAEAMRLLGLQDKIVATGDNTIQNNPYLGFDDKPDVGKTGEVNIELILSLEPDVVFTFTNRPDHVLEEKLEPAGIKVVRINNYLPEQMDQELRLLGKIFGVEERAEQFLDWKNSIEQLLADRVMHINESDKKSVMALSVGFLNSNGGYRVFPSQSLNGEPGVGEGYATILAGGKDAAADIKWDPTNSSTTILVDEEYVLEKNPEVLTLHGTWLGGYSTEDERPFKEVYDNIMNNSSVSQLNAGKTQDIYIFHTNMIGSDKRYIGTLQLAKYLYPDLFDDIDPEKYAKQYFETWLGVEYQGVWWFSAKNTDRDE